ncbi:MAG: TauD/TfdA family dioxygenase [Alphaproteobacteria bacterium]|jgi:alpha-ketoglutarate-dependent 2,4-dichlorophenoxyacetate dioxygenase|nr:TauD/TfdA family dioxygenase [Alphaproteobacteria bacterium]MDP6516477.1 TauD/TfdA family dioxygenase [Alphaproteobacteria bacterium]
MSVSVTRLQPDFVAEIGGLDLRRGTDDETFDTVLAAFHEHPVLVFHDQNIGDAQQIAFSRRFGVLERNVTDGLGGPPEIANLSNVEADGTLAVAGGDRDKFLSGNQNWHSDSSFKSVPAMASILSGREVPPEGGGTEFTDMRAAWDALPADRQAELERRTAEHSFLYSQGKISVDLMSEEEVAAVPPVHHPLVRIHPETGRKALYIGRHASHILGRPVADGRALLAELLAEATRPELVYRHRWRQHDLVMWDNRMVLHRGRAWDGSRYARVMHRTTIAGRAEDNPWIVEDKVA